MTARAPTFSTVSLHGAFRHLDLLNIKFAPICTEAELANFRFLYQFLTATELATPDTHPT